MRTIRLLAAALLILAGLGQAVAGSAAATGRVATRPEALRVMHVDPGEAVVQIALARQLPPALKPGDRQRLERVVRELKRDDRVQAQRHWSRLMRDVSGSAAPIDVALLIQWVLRESYVETLEDLRLRADKVRFFNEQKNAVREHLDRSRQVLRGMRRGSKVRVERISVAPRYKVKKDPVRVSGQRKLSDDELAEEIREWEQKLQTIGEDAQLANIDLQNALQKQQQTLQTMSNVSKMLHDTAMAVIRKIG